MPRPLAGVTVPSAIDWDHWSPAFDATLLFVVQDGRILLIEKKRGIGAGKVNGPGGKVDAGESPLQAAEREFAEEVQARAVGTEKRGEVWFHVLDGDSIRIHVFHADACLGQPTETAEARPFWVPVDRVPFDRMWEDDRYWLPEFVAGGRFEIRSVFRGDRLLAHEMARMPPGHVWDG